VEYGILGPLAVWDDDGSEVPIGAKKRREVLAALLLRRNELVPLERLIDQLWGERPPAAAAQAVRNHVHHLRKLLGTGAIATQPLGYQLRVGDDRLDAARFGHLLEHGRELLGAGRSDEASQMLREALALWRGPPLADFTYDEFAADEIGRLEELQLVALEQRLEADLRCWRDAAAVADLERLVREHPRRETLRRLLMLAYYWTGRQAEALAAYQDARATLLDEGIEPSPALQHLQSSILNHRPEVERAPRSSPAARTAEPPAPEPAEPDLDPRPQRKPVTVLYSDVANAGELAESLDPEALRALLASYFAETKAAAVRHGGVVERYIGEAAMAVFGLPAVHEDDALRALRAAVEMRSAAAELGIDARFGVASGEVVVGAAERLVAGGAVATAARLEQAARPGEILVGAGVLELARDAASAEALAPLAPAGRGSPVPAWRLLSVSARPPERDFDSPFVGRRRELDALTAAWERASAERRCELVTLLGAAGLGKSRLVAELLRRTDAGVAQGRCLSYGTGITYWPVVDVLGQLRAQLDALDASVAAPLRALLGGGGGASTDEVAWAFRKLAEAAALERPLVLVFDDVHWGEEALLELIEHVAVVSSGAPILLLCMARPELLDRRPGWGGVVRLEPLTAAQSESLVLARFGADEPPPDVRDSIVATSGGNPLFVEELSTMLHDAGGGEVAMPPTIQALLAARLDQLDEPARTVIEAAAVEGEVFHRGAVAALAPDEPRLGGRLTDLVRKDLVRPERPEFEGEDAFRFRHLLLREAAYEAIPKTSRSSLHERFATWLDGRDAGAEALVGHHLEQAYRCRVDVGDRGPAADALACSASERLEHAGTAALAGGDLHAASGLYARAAALPPVPGARRARLLADLAATLVETGELGAADRALGEARPLAASAGDECAEARVLVERQLLEIHRTEPGAADGVEELVTRVVPIFERAGEDRGLSRAWQLEASARWIRGGVSAATAGWERAAGHARRSGDEHEHAMILRWLASATWLGSMPVEDAIARCEEIRAEVTGHPASEAEILRPLAGLHGFAGRFDEARTLFARSAAIYAELGLELSRAVGHTEAVVEMLADNFAGAELRLRETIAALEARGENALRSTAAALLARALFAQARHTEAEAASELSEELAEPTDLVTQMLWRGVRARLLADRGELGDAAALAREAVALGEGTDLYNFRADTLVALAAVLDAAGSADEAAAASSEALRLYAAKGNTVAAESTRAFLDTLAAV
jgi:DNA-binding SARP family transcriptional activator